MKATLEEHRLYTNRTVIVVAMLICVRGVYAETPGPGPIGVPDVRANIMQMLQQEKGKGEQPEEDLFSLAEEQERIEEGVVEEVQTEPRQAEPQAEAVTSPETEPASKPSEKNASGGKPVDVPTKEIVIKDADDLKKLAEELRKAKERQPGR